MPKIDKRVEKKKERRRFARECLLRFLKAVNHLNEARVYAILKERNPDGHPVIEELFGLNEDETLQFLFQVSLIRRGKVFKFITVLESDWKSLASDGGFEFNEKEYYIRTSQKRKAYYISFGGQPKENSLETNHCVTATFLTCQGIFQNEVKEILASSENGLSLSSESVLLDSQEKFCTGARKASVDRLLDTNSKEKKRQNNNPTPIKCKPERNSAITHDDTSSRNIFPNGKENIDPTESYTSQQRMILNPNHYNPSFTFPHKNTENGNYPFSYAMQPGIDMRHHSYPMQYNSFQMHSFCMNAPPSNAQEYFAYTQPPTIDNWVEASKPLQGQYRGEMKKDNVGQKLNPLFSPPVVCSAIISPSLQSPNSLQQNSTISPLLDVSGFSNKYSVLGGEECMDPREALEDIGKECGVSAETEENMSISFTSMSSRAEMVVLGDSQDNNNNTCKDSWSWGPPPCCPDDDLTSYHVTCSSSNTTGSNTRTAGGSATSTYGSIGSTRIGGDPSNNNNKKINTDACAAGLLPWSDAKSLKKSLNERFSSDPDARLLPEELKIAQLLISKMLLTEGGVQKLVFPKMIGQNENLTFYRKPTYGARGRGEKGSKVTRKISRLVEKICVECNVSSTNLLESIVENSRRKEEGDSKKILIEKSLALMKLAGLSENAYHQIRVFTKDIFKIKWGASSTSIKQYLKVAIPPSDVFSMVLSLQVGSTESSSHKKFKSCIFWRHRYTLWVLAIRIKYLFNSGLFEPSSAISFLEDNTILTVSNIDKADKFTSCMVRILNEKDGNSGNSTIILGVTGDNASESYENLSKTFFSEGSPIRSTLQALLYNTLVVMRIALSNPNEKISEEISILHCLITNDFSEFPSHRQIRTIDISDKKFLKPSEDWPKVEKMDDFSNLCFLRHTEFRSIIAVAILNSFGEPSAWSRIGDDANLFPLLDSSVINIQWMRIIGYSGSDNKMCSIENGHQGASGKFPSYICTSSQGEMRDPNHKCTPRSGKFSNVASHEKFLAFGASTGPKDDNARRDECYNISLPPLLDVPIEKQMLAPSHTTTGVMAHLDSFLVKFLDSFEKKSPFYAQTQAMKISLSCHYKELQFEIKNRKRKLRKYRSDFTKFKENFGKNNAHSNPGYSKQLNELQEKLSQLDSQSRHAHDYVLCIKEALETIEQYLDGHSESLLVTCLNQCYLAVTKVCLGRHHGGRNFLFRDAHRVATQFEDIAKCYMILIEKLNAEYDFSFDLNKIYDEISKTVTCCRYLGPIITMAESQKKFDEVKVAALKLHCEKFFKEVMNQYPDINVCLKLHLVHRHLYELPEKCGFLGRGNEQGSESCHVRVNKIASICRASKGADQFALAMQKKLRMGDLSQVGCIENDFISGRTKIVNRKKIVQ